MTVPVEPSAVPPTLPVEPAVEPSTAAPSVEPAPPVAPPVEPVVPPVNETPPKPAFEKTGNAFYDNAGAILHEAGVDASAAEESIRANNGMLDEALRSQLVEKLGESQTYMLEQGLAGENTRQATNVKAVYDEVGGEEAWTQIAEWSRSEAGTISKEDADKYNRMLAEGGSKATEAAAKIKEAYVNDPTNNVPANGVLDGDTTPPAAGNMEAISRATYMTEKKAAVRIGDAVTVRKLEERANFTSSKHPDLWRPIMSRF